MINKKIVFSAISILGALALMGGTAFAAIVDQVNANDNTLASSTPTLELSADGVNFYHAISSGLINISNIRPGTPVTGVFYLRNNDGANPIAINTTFSTTAGSGIGTTVGLFLEQDLKLSLSCEDGENVAADNFKNWEAAGKNLSGTLAAGATTKCTMTANLPTGIYTDFNQTLGFNAVFSASL